MSDDRFLIIVLTLGMLLYAIGDIASDSELHERINLLEERCR